MEGIFMQVDKQCYPLQQEEVKNLEKGWVKIGG